MPGTDKPPKGQVVPETRAACIPKHLGQDEPEHQTRLAAKGALLGEGKAFMVESRWVEPSRSPGLFKAVVMSMGA